MRNTNLKFVNRYFEYFARYGYFYIDLPPFQHPFFTSLLGGQVTSVTPIPIYNLSPLQQPILYPFLGVELSRKHPPPSYILTILQGSPLFLTPFIWGRMTSATPNPQPHPFPFLGVVLFSYPFSGQDELRRYPSPTPFQGYPRFSYHLT